MKKRYMLSISLLSLFLLSSMLPFVLANVNFTPEALKETDLYSKSVVDRNEDKIDDKFLQQLDLTNSYYVDAVVIFDYRINDDIRNRLAGFDALCSEETWDNGRRIKITTTREILDDIAQLPGVQMITSAEKRHITVGILGNDFSDLAILEEKYDDVTIFWNVGCAVIRYYSGVENDINNLGRYTSIFDATDFVYTPSIVEGKPSDYSTKTLSDANIINVSSMWSLGYNGGGIKVGNIDTGVNYGHSDIGVRYIDGESFVKIEFGYDFDDPDIDDYSSSGHGSHTSGTILGDGTVNSQYIGMAPGALLYFAKIGDWTQSGSPATQESIIAAINWLVDQDVDVINFSYGGTDTPGMDPSEIAFANAVRNDAITVCISAGNEGADGLYTVGSPGAIPDSITVGAIDTTHGTPYDMPYFSSKGVTTDNHMKPDVLAPGVGIVSLGKSGDSYNTLQGTSMSCPHVTGAAAVLIQACKANGFSKNPGVIKAALLQTAKQLSPLEDFPYILQGKGYVNVGAAWTYILNSEKNSGAPYIGACNPIKQPLALWSEVKQGQVLEQFLTCVSPFKNASRNLVVTGDVAPFVTLGSFNNQYSSPNKITYTIPTNATLGTYTGQIEYKFNNLVFDTIDIELEVTQSNGHRMLLHHKSTNWHQNNLFGQYKYFVEDIYDNGWVVSEQEVDLTTDILNSYEAIWFPDPFSYTYPQAYLGDYSVRGTYNAPSETEITNMHNYLANGGTLFFDFLGHVDSEFTLEGYAGTNITLINSFIEQYGISIRPNVWTSDATIPVNALTSTPLTAGVSSIDHYGASLEIMDGYNVTMVTELTPGSEYATCAIAETEGGGRIIVMGTNFALDTIGYINGYNAGVTQNDVFGMNLVRWATAKHRMQRLSVTDNGDGTITFKYLYANGPGADFGGYVDTPSGRVSLTGWTDNGEGVYTLNYEFQSKGAHHFYPECGESGVDDFDYYYINATKSGGLGIGTVGIILLGIFGLSGWYLIQRRRK